VSTAGKHHLHMEVTLVDSVVVEVKCVLYLYMILTPVARYLKEKYSSVDLIPLIFYKLSMFETEAREQYTIYIY